MRSLKLFHGRVEPRSGSAGKVDHHANILAVHHGQQSLGRGQEIHLLTDPDSIHRFGGDRKMGMDVDHCCWDLSRLRGKDQGWERSGCLQWNLRWFVTTFLDIIRQTQMLIAYGSVG